MSKEFEGLRDWALPALTGLAVVGWLWFAPEPERSRPTLRRSPRRRRCDCTRYIGLFEEYGEPRGIPTAYLRALACRESTCDPGDRKGPAWGLMQITEVVRRSEDREDGRDGRYSRPELLDPAVSVFLCTRVLGKTMKILNRLGIETDWHDSKWVGLVTAGWNAGYSLRGGLGLTVKYLLREGWRPDEIDIVVVHEHAERAGATRFLWKFPHRLKWWRSVVELYFRMLNSQE